MKSILILLDILIVILIITPSNYINPSLYSWVHKNGLWVAILCLASLIIYYLITLDQYFPMQTVDYLYYEYKIFWGYFIHITISWAILLYFFINKRV